MAERTPMSRTRVARWPNASASCTGRPNSLTRVAPGAENRSVICEVMAALWLGRLPLEHADPGADPPGGDDEHGQQQRRRAA